MTPGDHEDPVQGHSHVPPEPASTTGSVARPGGPGYATLGSPAPAVGAPDGCLTRPGGPTLPAAGGPGAAAPRLTIAPAFRDRQARGTAGRAEPVRVLPRPPEPYAGGVTVVADGAAAAAMREFACQRALSFAGIDVACRHDRPGVVTRRDRTWHDPKSVVPLLMGLVLVEGHGDGRALLYRFALDVRRPEVVDHLAELLHQPIPFAVHFARDELFAIWKLGLPAPDRIWDTWIAERAFHLGLFHARYQGDAAGDDVEQLRAQEEAEEDITATCSLPATCLRHGVHHGFAAAKDRLRESFLHHPDDQPFTAEQIAYAIAEAEAVARLYPLQVQRAIALSALDHLKAVEMPTVITTSRMSWDGVRVDKNLVNELKAACNRHAESLLATLAGMGLTNVNSHPALTRFFRSVGLLEAFREGQGFSFDDDHLKAIEDRHPAISMIRTARKIRRLRSDRLLSGELVGGDGRLHPDHRQLGAESGRNAMRDPNIGGIGKALRPLVVPEDPETWAIGEVDLSQIEVLIAAAECRDPDLLEMVNGRDVYCAMARRYFADRLTPADIALPDEEFKKRHRLFRDLMKIFTLATIYNITPVGLSHQLGVSVRRAAEEQARFLGMFAVMERALRESSGYGAIRGYAQVCTGLRRNRARHGRPTTWEVNWLRNTPIQGSASVVFKVAGNRLYHRYQFYGARLLLPLHDAYVFECPRAHLDVVARLTAEVMTGAVQEYYPMLDPRADVNIDQPHCWNKDGKSRSLELWLTDPGIARNHLKS